MFKRVSSIENVFTRKMEGRKMKSFSFGVTYLVLFLALTIPSQAEFLYIEGKVNALMVQNIGGQYGPPSDQIDVEVIVGMDSREGANGFQLRNDENRLVRQGMLDVLRGAFQHGWKVQIITDIPDGKKNGIIRRVSILK